MWWGVSRCRETKIIKSLYCILALHRDPMSLYKCTWSQKCLQNLSRELREILFMPSDMEDSVLCGLVALVCFSAAVSSGKTTYCLHCLCLGPGRHQRFWNWWAQNQGWPPVVFRHLVLRSFRKGWWLRRAAQHLGIVYRDLTLDCSLQKPSLKDSVSWEKKSFGLNFILQI